MNSFPLAWAVATVLFLVTLYLAKSIHDRHLAPLRQLYWRGLVVISVIGGAILAYAYVTLTADEVPLPPELANSPTIATPTE